MLQPIHPQQETKNLYILKSIKYMHRLSNRLIQWRRILLITQKFNPIFCLYIPVIQPVSSLWAHPAGTPPGRVGRHWSWACLHRLPSAWPPSSLGSQRQSSAGSLWSGYAWCASGTALLQTPDLFLEGNKGKKGRLFEGILWRDPSCHLSRAITLFRNLTLPEETKN